MTTTTKKYPRKPKKPMTDMEVLKYIRKVMGKFFSAYKTDFNEFDDFCQDCFIRYMRDKDKDDFSLANCVLWSFGRSLWSLNRYRQIKGQAYRACTPLGYQELVDGASILNPTEEDYYPPQREYKSQHKGPFFSLMSEYSTRSANPDELKEDTQVANLLSKLTDRQRRRVELKLQGLTAEEIAEVEGVSRQAVHCSLVLATRFLSEALDRPLPETLLNLEKRRARTQATYKQKQKVLKKTTKESKDKNDD